MLKPFTVHPSSVLIGLGLAGLIFFASGATQAGGSVRPVPVEQQIIGHIPAPWWTSVSVEAPTTTYVVPADRYFVVTKANSLGVKANGVDVDLSVLHFLYADPDPNGTRISFQPGTLLSGALGGGMIQLWGYLEPVR